jgi:DNA polymerase-3 subunit gamma/tau
MDQAIASAPLIDGKARLDAGQIRELMGTVANTVFERILQAVNENRSAEVMTIANELLDAGNSPAQLARQAVRYLRGCLIAKVAGLTPEGPEGTELLQISPEEQRRAARTAALFTEEELTRFLQVMLRTFDEMGYRQEQRFHFELGLLKLVHLRRLLPVEEVLSALGGGAAIRPAAASIKPQGAASPARPSLSGIAPASVKPAFSPFEQDKQRRRYDGISGGTSGANALAVEPVVSRNAAAPAPSLAAPILAAPILAAPIPMTPLPPAVSAPVPVEAPVAVSAPATIVDVFAEAGGQAGVEVAGEAAVEASAAIDQEAVALQRAVISALQAVGQGSAADAMEDATWTVVDREAKVQTQLSKTMLPVHMNPEAEKIARAAVLKQGLRKLTLLPGASVAGGVKKPRVHKAGGSGSAQSKAESHPLVQQAQKLFEAEIQTVFDLSGKE